MKSKDLQKLILFKYEVGQTLKKNFQDLNGAVSYQIVKRWCKMIRKTGTTDLSKPSACHRTVFTKALRQGVKRFLEENWCLKWTCLSQVFREFSGKILK